MERPFARAQNAASPKSCSTQRAGKIAMIEHRLPALRLACVRGRLVSEPQVDRAPMERWTRIQLPPVSGGEAFETILFDNEGVAAWGMRGFIFKHPSVAHDRFSAAWRRPTECKMHTTYLWESNLGNS